MSRQQVPFSRYKPKKLNDAAWRALVEAWENGLSDREAAFYVEKNTGTPLSSTEIQEICVDNPETGELRAMLLSDLLTASKMTIAKSIKKGDVRTAKWYAERKGADEFSTKQAVALEGAVVELSIEDKRKAAQEFVEQMKQNGE